MNGTGSGEIRALTGLRGVGAAWVLAYHLCLTLGVPTLHGVLLRGYLAVDMFFILSGFVLARSHGAQFARDRSSGGYAGFAVTRFVRLWPVYAAVTLVVVLVRTAWNGSPPWPNQVAANLLMVQSWGLSGSIVVPGWSVSTEWAASLLFPLLAIPALQARRVWAVVAVGGAASGLWAAATLARSLPHGRRGDLDIYDGWSLLPLGRCLAGVTVGMVLCRAVAHPAVARALAHPWLAPAIAALLAAGLLGGATDGWLYPLLPLLVGALALGAGPFARTLGGSLGVWAGRLSYPVYLLHVPLIDAAAELDLRDWWPAIPVIVVALALPAHLWLEQPARRWWRGPPPRLEAARP